MKKRKGLLPGWLVPLAFVALCGYLFFLLIQYQVSIASKQQELQSLQDQLTAQETTNAELSSTGNQKLPGTDRGRTAADRHAFPADG